MEEFTCQKYNRKSSFGKGLVMSDRVKFKRIINDEMTIAGLTSRLMFARSGLDFLTRRDLESQCHFILKPTVNDYKRYFDFDGATTRAISVFSDECWAEPPEVYQTEESYSTAWERRFEDLNERHSLFSYFHKVDVKSGIGHYGGLLIGLDDGKDPSEPVSTIDPLNGIPYPDVKKEHDILYLRALDETELKILKLNTDPTSRRFGMPELYRVQFYNPMDVNYTVINYLNVHWTRIVHIPSDSVGGVAAEIYANPRVQNVFQYLQSARKVIHSSAEMFYKGAFPGYALKTIPDPTGMTSVALDKESISAEMYAYQNDLKRYVALQDMEIEPLTPQIEIATAHLEDQLKMVATVLGVPYRIYMGSESGHLASSQDKTTWNGRVSGRQKNRCNPVILRPTLQRFQDLNVLPRVKKFYSAWNDLNNLTDMDKADIALKQSQAMMAYIKGGCDVLLPPLEYLTTVLGLTLPVAQAVEKARLGYIEEHKKDKTFLSGLTIPEKDPLKKGAANPGTGSNPGVS